MPKQQSPMPDLQSDWDEETLTDFASRCQRMMAKLRELRAEEHTLREKRREVRKAARAAGLMVEDYLSENMVDATRETDPAVFAARVRDLVTAAELWSAEARKAKEEYQLARARREGAADELRVFLNSYLQRLPLFDGLPAAQQ